MRKTLAALFLFASVSRGAPTKIDGMYVNTFGDPAKQPLIFVHGGPGFHSWDFELTTADKLAKAGYYVVVYDQRGQGRSEEADASHFNYKRYTQDLKLLIDRLGLKNPVLIGHSHGGAISLKFDEAFPGVAKAIALVSAPLHFWGTFRGVLENCAARYETNGDTTNLNFVTRLYASLFVGPEPPKETLPFLVGSTLLKGMECGLYRVKNPTPHAKALSKLLKENPVKGPLAGQSTAMPGFLANENYIHLNLVDYAYTQRSRLCGVFGQEDGLFTSLEIGVLRQTLSRFQLLRGASHALYLDQQDAFLDALKTTCHI